jgi:cytidine deaminase
MPTPPPQQLRHLVRAAQSAAGHAHAPYSHFPVGAAVLTDKGRIFAGCNVENASSGLGMCAERTAIFSAVAASKKPLRLRCVVVYTPTTQPTAPCGACRQVIHEFGPAARVISVCDGSEKLDVTLESLLPASFGPANLIQSESSGRRKRLS